MNIQEQITTYINSQPEPKHSDMQTLHSVILKLKPGCKLWFLDGKNNDGKTVSNPNIGYGSYIIKYTNGETREFYQIGLSANTTGISVYVMGIKDKTYLAQTYGNKIGKASITEPQAIGKLLQLKMEKRAMSFMKRLNNLMIKHLCLYHINMFNAIFEINIACLLKPKRFIKFFQIKLSANFNGLNAE